MILLCRQPIYEPRPVWSAFYISLSIVHKSCVLSLTALFVIKILAHPPGPCMSQPTARNTCLSIPAPVTYNHYHITPHCRSTNQELGIFNSWSITIHHGDLHPKLLSYKELHPNKPVPAVFSRSLVLLKTISCVLYVLSSIPP